MRHTTAFHLQCQVLSYIHSLCVCVCFECQDRGLNFNSFYGYKLSLKPCLTMHTVSDLAAMEDLHTHTHTQSLSLLLKSVFFLVCIIYGCTLQGTRWLKCVLPASQWLQQQHQYYLCFRHRESVELLLLLRDVIV